MSSPSLWPNITKTMLVGTQRMAQPLPAPGGALGALLQDFPSTAPEERVLAAAGAAALHRKAGMLPVRLEKAPAAAPADEQPIVNDAAALLLERLIQGEFEELFGAAMDILIDSGRTLPPRLLPEFLEKGAADAEQRERIRRTVGARGRWLAAQNPSWSYVIEVLDVGTWETGARAERLQLLTTLRKTDRPKARELLASTWERETPDDREDFLLIVGRNADLEDEPFLESALDDKRKGVRTAASSILQKMAGSRLVARMEQRVKALVDIGKHGIKMKLPEKCDAAMVRDGVEPKPRAGTGEKGWWLLQMISAMPPSKWNIRAHEALEIVKKEDFKRLFLEGWSIAAANFKDPEWSDAFFFKHPDVPDELAEQLYQNIPRARREAFLVESFKRDTKKVQWERPALRSAAMHREPWSMDLSRAAIGFLKVAPKFEDNRIWGLLHEAHATMAAFMAPSVVDELLSLRPADPEMQPAWEHLFGKLTAALTFRRQLAAELPPQKSEHTHV